jgi:hypothetical protein
MRRERGNYAEFFSERIKSLSPKKAVYSIRIFGVVHFLPVGDVGVSSDRVCRDDVLNWRFDDLSLAVIWLTTTRQFVGSVEPLNPNPYIPCILSTNFDHCSNPQSVISLIYGFCRRFILLFCAIFLLLL